MRTKIQMLDEAMGHVSVDDLLHGVGMELMMKSEELIYATRSLDEAGCEELGSDLYLLARVVGAILMQYPKKYADDEVSLPSDIGMVKVRNPYYQGQSEGPTDSLAGPTAGSLGELPF